MIPPLIEKSLRESAERHGELEKQISDPEVIAKPSLYRALSRECGSLGKLVERFNEYLRVAREIEENEELSRGDDDPELRQMARDELDRLKPELESLSSELTDRIGIARNLMVVVNDDADSVAAVEKLEVGSRKVKGLYRGATTRLDTKLLRSRKRLDNMRTQLLVQ